MPCEDCLLPTHSKREVTNLREDIWRLSEELRKKDALLSSYIETATTQAKKISALNSVVTNSSTSDTLLWDPINSHPSSCPTTNPEGNWTEVMVKGAGKGRKPAISPPLLHLSNHYTALSDGEPDHPGDNDRSDVAPDRTFTGLSPDPMHHPVASSPAGASCGKWEPWTKQPWTYFPPLSQLLPLPPSLCLCTPGRVLQLATSGPHLRPGLEGHTGRVLAVPISTAPPVPQVITPTRRLSGLSVYLCQYYRVLFSTGMSLIRRGSPRRVRTFNIRIFFSVSAHRYPHRSSVAQLIASLSDSLPVLWPNCFCV
ncbi:hypothetical protein INR49_031988 [Caranx melampygus]|nr:hypothetical protein INR49_031988 [Caranx melampygus]